MRTFTVRKDKPFILHDRQDAFSFFQAHLQGHVLDCIYNILRTAHGANSKLVSNALALSPSADPEYLKKVVAESRKREESEEEAKK